MVDIPIQDWDRARVEQRIGELAGTLQQWEPPEEDITKRELPPEFEELTDLGLELAETFIRDAPDQRTVERRVYELLEHVNDDDTFVKRFEAMSLLRLLARDEIRKGNGDSEGWRNRWDVHRPGVTVKAMPVLAWAIARDDLDEGDAPDSTASRPASSVRAAAILGAGRPPGRRMVLVQGNATRLVSGTLALSLSST